MVAYAKPQQKRKEESERLTGEQERDMMLSLVILDLKEGR